MLEKAIANARQIARMALTRVSDDDALDQSHAFAAALGDIDRLLLTAQPSRAGSAGTSADDAHPAQGAGAVQPDPLTHQGTV